MKLLNSIRDEIPLGESRTLRLENKEVPLEFPEVFVVVILEYMDVVTRKCFRTDFVRKWAGVESNDSGRDEPLLDLV